MENCAVLGIPIAYTSFKYLGITVTKILLKFLEIYMYQLRRNCTMKKWNQRQEPQFY